MFYLCNDPLCTICNICHDFTVFIISYFYYLFYLNFKGKNKLVCVEAADTFCKNLKLLFLADYTVHPHSSWRFVLYKSCGFQRQRWLLQPVEIFPKFNHREQNETFMSATTRPIWKHPWVKIGAHQHVMNAVTSATLLPCNCISRQR